MDQMMLKLVVKYTPPGEKDLTRQQGSVDDRGIDCIQTLRDRYFPGGRQPFFDCHFASEFLDLCQRLIATPWDRKKKLFYVLLDECITIPVEVDVDRLFYPNVARLLRFLLLFVIEGGGWALMQS